MQFSEARTIVVANPHFVLERVEFHPGSIWMIDIEKEGWLLVIGGSAKIGSIEVALGQAVFMEGDRADIQVGDSGLKALLAYPGPNANPGAFTQRHDSAEDHSSLAPSMSDASKHLLPRTPEAQT
jgi:mannose-6-phosphate isomerase